MPIPEETLDHPANRHILCPAHHSVGQAITQLQEAGGSPAWAIVIDYGAGSARQYGLTWVKSLAQEAGLISEGPPYRAAPIDVQLETLGRSAKPLATIQPDAWLKTVEQDALDADAALVLAAKSPGRALAVTQEGEFAGLVVARLMRRRPRSKTLHELNDPAEG